MTFAIALEISVCWGPSCGCPPKRKSLLARFSCVIAHAAHGSSMLHLSETHVTSTVVCALSVPLMEQALVNAPQR